MVGPLACTSQSNQFCAIPETPNPANFPAGPILFVTPLSYTWQLTPNLVQYIGQNDQSSITIEDLGLDPLVVKSVTLNDPNNVFTLDMPAPAVCTGGGLDGGLLSYPQQIGAITFHYAPQDMKVYDATITITTNAVNDGGVAVVNIEAIGCESPDDGGMCADAGPPNPYEINSCAMELPDGGFAPFDAG